MGRWLGLTAVPSVEYPPIGKQLLIDPAPPSGCRLKTPPGEAGHRRPSPPRCALARTLSATDEGAALPASRRWFTEVKP